MIRSAEEETGFQRKKGLGSDVKETNCEVFRNDILRLTGNGGIDEMLIFVVHLCEVTSQKKNILQGFIPAINS
ncbi:hypothetical protein RUM44_012667 [Polyplax serrata]|uniref:Uncharacterized protein n=1 Tax=Polyplax serrata TaxID=468196 RepID=A0ABR1BBY8_POLSC